MVIGQITSLIIKHEKDISTLTEEVIMLKNLVQNLSLQLTKNFSKERESNEKEKHQDNVQKEVETTPKENSTEDMEALS